MHIAHERTEMQINLQIKGLHEGEPIELDLDINITATEMIEVYQSAPEIVKEFRAIMNEEKAMAKAKKAMRRRN